MKTSELSIERPPIIEAVIDLNCDMPPSFDLESLKEEAKRLLRDSYPKAKVRVLQEHQFRAEAEKPPAHSVRKQVEALQFLAEDEKQLVQFRREGFSFNRLAPYSSLDDYIPEIERTWHIFRELAQPVQIRRVGLRYINRILLPTVDRKVELRDYFRVSPQLADEETLDLIGFADQRSAVETATGNRVNIAMVMQPLQGERLPIILDIDTFDSRSRPPEEWEEVRKAIESLRRLKNRIFERTVTEECLNLFQPRS